MGIIGMGRIGKVHLQSISGSLRNASVKAVADPYLSDNTAAWAKGFGVECVTRDYRDILSDGAIDAVLLCSSTATHAPLSLEAISAGKHVFCEKPVSQNIASIREVQLALAGTQLKYQVGFNRRFDHNFRTLYETVRSGKIGSPHVIKITSRDPEPPNPKYIGESGGMFLDMTIHDFDMVRYLSGCEVEEVSTSAAVLVDPAIGEQGDVDTAVITMKLSNGSLAVIDNSRRAAYGYDQRAEVFGSTGMAAVSNDTPSTVVISTAEGISGEKPLYFFLERYMQSFTEEVRQFVTSIEEDKTPSVGINDGLQPVRIAEAARRSLLERRPVSLTEIL